MTDRVIYHDVKQKSDLVLNQDSGGRITIEVKNEFSVPHRLRPDDARELAIWLLEAANNSDHPTM